MIPALLVRRARRRALKSIFDSIVQSPARPLHEQVACALFVVVVGVSSRSPGSAVMRSAPARRGTAAVGGVPDPAPLRARRGAVELVTDRRPREVHGVGLRDAVGRGRTVIVPVPGMPGGLLELDATARDRRAELTARRSRRSPARSRRSLCCVRAQAAPATCRSCACPSSAPTTRTTKSRERFETAVVASTVAVIVATPVADRACMSSTVDAHDARAVARDRRSPCRPGTPCRCSCLSPAP